jgi:hypothetical protein
MTATSTSEGRATRLVVVKFAVDRIHPRISFSLVEQSSALLSRGGNGVLSFARRSEADKPEASTDKAETLQSLLQTEEPSFQEDAQQSKSKTLVGCAGAGNACSHGYQ